MSALLIAMMIVLYTLQSFLCKKYSDNYPGDKSMASPVFTIASGLTVAVVSLALGGFKFEANLLTVVLGIINAAVLFGYNTCLIKASCRGPYSVLMVFLISGGIIVPTACAGIIFREGVSFGKLISVAAILVSVYMISNKPQDKELRAAKNFIPLCMGLALTNGTYGALLDVQQRLTGQAQKDEMVAVTFLFAFAFSAVYLASGAKNRFLSHFKQTRTSLFYLLTCSVCAALAINLLVYVLMLVDVTVLYTFDNSGVFLVSVLLSVIFLKEKLSLTNKIGCVLMCAALVGVSIL